MREQDIQSRVVVHDKPVKKGRGASFWTASLISNLGMVNLNHELKAHPY